MPSDSWRPRLGSALGAGALILGILLLLLGGVFGGLFWAASAIRSGVHPAAEPSSSTYGVCDGHSPWSCTAVPTRTIEAKFGRTIPQGATVLTAEAEPTAGITGRPQIQVVVELPKGATADSWLSILSHDAVPVADAAQVPELAELGVTNITGGATGFTSVYAGQLNGRVYLWAYSRL
ncbi:hypothetical protein [Curtobacterium sp. MCBD17_040]|uniref:hypothetical protein n=1 Tax=Curtobacterium sp. MCBD17_040 TaxID=2175674 RepID=UPI0011B52D8D|nr:hypothetical protein [Curtobacterium sp. MCBD17_040]WIB65515.1 hypothetical protein DEI94_19265 [Curtobacterium sp. MCBD17_040]